MATGTTKAPPVHVSTARGWPTGQQRYRVYSDRIELDLNFPFLKKTFVIAASDIIAIWVSDPPALKNIPRIGGIRAAFRGLKLDWADLFPHVGLHRRRTGYFEFFFFAPRDPQAFVDAVKSYLMSRAG